MKQKYKYAHQKLQHISFLFSFHCFWFCFCPGLKMGTDKFTDTDAIINSGYWSSSSVIAWSISDKV